MDLVKLVEKEIGKKLGELERKCTIPLTKGELDNKDWLFFNILVSL